MQLWTFDRYRKPYLRIDAVEIDPERRLIEIIQGDQTYHLAIDSAPAAIQLAEELNRLKDRSSPLWDAMRGTPEDGPWRHVLTFLDNRSLIAEGCDAGAEILRSRKGVVEQCIEATAARSVLGLGPECAAVVAANAARLRQIALKRLKGAAVPFDFFDAQEEPNFFIALVMAELAYFERSSPLTLTAVECLLARMAGKAGVSLEDNGDLQEALALYDLKDLESHLWLVAQALVASAAAGALRLPTPPVPALPQSSGLEFMRQTEVMTRTTLKMWGQNPYVAALDALDDTYSPLVAGPFIEQYHVTRRFVEIIAPLLSKRLASPLRQMMFQYYGEEVGHEALESTTCEALGVEQAALDRAMPLPLHFAFVDVLTLLAEIDPFAAFASIMAIEGVFGEPPKMSLRLAAVARTNPAFQGLAGDHDDLNEDLNHNSIARDAFESIAAAPSATQGRVMRRILFLLELNHRAWGGIADYYGQQQTLHLQGALGAPLSTTGVLI